MKKIFKSITAITLVASVALSAAVNVRSTDPLFDSNVTAHASDSKSGGGAEYVSSIAVSHKDSYEKAQADLGDEYTILDKDFNDGMSSHAWIGYTTTDDPDMAITDIKVMNMNGGFNYSDYEELLKSQKEAVQAQVETVKPALIEFAKNYDAGLETAKGICETLNVYYEDDSEKNLGDFLLDTGRSLVNNSSDKEALENIEKVFLQGNDTLVGDVENLLMLSQDTKLKKNGSWLTRLSLLGPDGLVALYKKANPKLSNAKIKAQIKKDYGDDADAILNEISKFQENLKDYEETELAKTIDSGDEAAIEEEMADTLDVSVTSNNDISDEDEAIEAYVQNTNESAEVYEAGNNVIMAGIVETLKAASYGSGTAYDFFMRDDLTAEDLYPVAYVLTKGQKSLMEDVGLYGIFEAILAEDSEDAGESWDTDMESGAVSIYQGVDRSIFTSDTAITGEALKRLSSKGDSIVYEPLIYGTMAAGLAVCVIAGIQMVKSSKALAGVLGEGKSLEKALNAEKFAVLAETAEADLVAMDRGFALSIMQKKGWLNGYKFVWKDFMAMNSARQYQVYMNAFRSLKPNQQSSLLENLNYGVREQKIAAIRETTLLRMEQTQLSEKLAANRAAGAGVRKSLMGARIVFAVAAVVAVATAVYEIYNICSKDNVDFTDIPLNMVDRSYPSGSDEITYIYYSLVCDGNGDKTDLHNLKGKEWLGIYTTTDSAAGDPIQAKSLMVSNEATSANADYEPLTLFGEAASYNLCDKSITGKSVDDTYVFYTKDANSVAEPEEIEEQEEETLEDADETTEGDVSDASVTGTVITNGGVVWLVIIVIAVVVIVAVAFIYRRKNRK